MFFSCKVRCLLKKLNFQIANSDSFLRKLRKFRKRRKGFEMYLSVLIQVFWGKWRKISNSATKHLISLSFFFSLLSLSKRSRGRVSRPRLFVFSAYHVRVESFFRQEIRLQGDDRLPVFQLSVCKHFFRPFQGNILCVQKLPFV